MIESDMSQQQKDDLRFNLLRNAIYHASRAKFFDSCTRLFNFLAIVSGAAVVSTFGDPKIVGLIVVVLGAFQLVANFGVLARDHQYFQRRCYEMIGELDKLAANNTIEIAKIDEKLKACDLEGKQTSLKRVNWYESLLRNLYPFNGTDFYAPPR
jgi:hypothetical protein